MVEKLSALEYETREQVAKGLQLTRHDIRGALAEDALQASRENLELKQMFADLKRQLDGVRAEAVVSLSCGSIDLEQSHGTVQRKPQGARRCRAALPGHHGRDPIPSCGRRCLLRKQPSSARRRPDASAEYPSLKGPAAARAGLTSSEAKAEAENLSAG